MAYSPLARMDSDLHTNPKLKIISEKYNKSVNQIILRWDIDTGCIPIPASKSELHIKENFDVLDFQLSQEEVATIDSLEQGKRIRYNPRTRFDAEQKKSFLKYRVKNMLKKMIGEKGCALVCRLRNIMSVAK